jgi:hypothetical protein
VGPCVEPGVAVRGGHPCSACGRFAFPAPRVCYWCGPRYDADAAPARVAAGIVTALPDSWERVRRDLHHRPINVRTAR